MVRTTGVTLEHKGVNLGNNSLISLDDIGEGGDAILCVTDNMQCCDERDGSWYLPNGTLVLSDANTSYPQTIYTTREINQTVTLNTVHTNTVNESVLPVVGIYSCGILDSLNNKKHLYIGIYPRNEGIAIDNMYVVAVLVILVCNNILTLGNITSVTLEYDKEHQSIICVSTGGPVELVIWSLNDVLISRSGQDYVSSQVIVDGTSATYENRLSVINKSSAAAGVYRCMVENSLGSLHAELDIQGSTHGLNKYIINDPLTIWRHFSL